MPSQHKNVKCHCGAGMRSDNLARHMLQHSENSISNYVWKERGTNKDHCFLLPRDICGIIVGKSGFGKTTLLTYLLLQPDMLDYDTLTICGRSLHQPEYKIMNQAFSKGFSKRQVNQLFENQDMITDQSPLEFIEE